MKKTLNTIKNLMLISTMLIFTISCNNVRKDYEKAQSQNTVEIYRAFIEKYPESEYFADAESKIIKLEWEIVAKNGDLTDLNEFIKKHPNSSFVDSAWFCINSLLLSKAKIEGNLKAYYDYLLKTKDHPIDPSVKSVNIIIDSLRFDSVKTIGTQDAYSEFYEKFHSSHFYNKAKQLSGDTIISGVLILLVDAYGKPLLLTLETNARKYDIFRPDNCKYINIESRDDDIVLNSGGMYEVAGRIYYSDKIKTNNSFYTNNKTIKANYLKFIKN